MSFTAWSIISIVASIFIGLIAYGRSRYREGRKDAEREQDRKNVEAHRKAGKVMAQPRDRKRTVKRMRDGNF